MSKRKWFWVLAAVALGAALLNFVVPKRERTSRPDCCLVEHHSDAPPLGCTRPKIYAAEGIEPKEYSFTSSSEPISAMANGDADFLPGVAMLDIMNGCSGLSLHPILISHSRVTMTPPFECLIVPNGSPVANLKDLEGKTIAVNPGQASTAALKYFLTQKKVDVSTIRFRPLPPAQHLLALQSGDVACSHTYEPFRSLCLKGNGMHEIYGSVYASLNDPCALGGTLISYKLWVENRELAEKLIRVWDRSIRFIRDHRKEAREIMRKRLNLPDSVAQDATWVEACLSTELDRQTVEATIAVYKKMGLLDESFEFDSSYYYK